VRDLRVKGNQFALKEVIDPKKRDRVHFLFEGEILKQLDSSSLPRVYHVFEDEPRRRVYLLMDYTEGKNLDQLRRQQPGQRFSLPDALRLLAPIVEAVSYLHKWQPPIIHRDIKPANIIVPSTGDAPVLVDFGIAKEYDRDATTTAVRRLSPNYCAPEQYSQGTNPRTDIYGMAATLYALLTGTPPVDAFERITEVGNRGIDPLEPANQLVPEIPASVAKAIQRGMALAIDNRFPTVEAFWQALQPESFQSTFSERNTPLPPARFTTPLALASSDDVTAPTGNVPSQRRRAERSRVLLPLIVLIALAALLFGGLLGTGILSANNPIHRALFSGVAATRPPVSATQTSNATHPSVTSTSSASSTPTTAVSPSPSAKPSPTTASANVPTLNNTYIGTIHNTPGNIDGTMTLTAVQQNGANIHGNFALSNGLSGQATFTGTVSSSSNVQFLVTPYTQYPPLLFQGHINADQSLTGTYCSARGNQCDYASGGYGTWKVAPPSSSSMIPSETDGRRRGAILPY
jgi:serine/threonine protein kinase